MEYVCSSAVRVVCERRCIIQMQKRLIEYSNNRKLDIEFYRVMGNCD